MNAVPRSGIRLRGVHHRVPDEFGVFRTAHALERQRELALQQRRVRLPAGERVVEELLAVGLVEGRAVPARVRVGGEHVVDERRVLAGSLVGHAPVDVAADLGPGVLPPGERHVLRHVDAELEGVREAVEDVERHVGRGRPARPPGEPSRVGLRLAELGERGVPVGLRDPRIEDAREIRARLSAPGLLEPRRLLELHLPVRVGRVPRLEPRVALRELLRHRGDGRVVAEDRRDDPGREKAVECLLRALVRIVHEVRQGRQDRVKELPVDRDDELLVDARRVVRLGHVGEGQRPALAAPERGKARLRELHPSGQHRHRPPLAVRQVAGDRRRLDRVRTDATRRRQPERHVRPGARGGRERKRRALRREAELRQRARVGRRVEDLEPHAAREPALGRVVDDDLEVRRVALAQEPRDVRPHHQVLDAARLLLDGAGLQVLRHGVDPDAPGRDRVGDRELDRGRAVGAGQELRLPERGLGEVGADRDGRRRRRRGPCPPP